MCWNWLMVTKGLFIPNPIRKMLAFKHSKPWGEPSTILLCKAPVYQAFAVQSQFCMKLGEKVHSWLHTDTGLCSQGPSRQNASFFRGRAINMAITEAAHRLVHARPGVKLGRGGGGGGGRPQGGSLPPKAAVSLPPSSWWWTFALPGRWAWTARPAAPRGRTRGPRTPAPLRGPPAALGFPLGAWESHPSKPGGKTVESLSCMYFGGTAETWHSLSLLGRRLEILHGEVLEPTNRGPTDLPL